MESEQAASIRTGQEETQSATIIDVRHCRFCTEAERMSVASTCAQLREGNKSDDDIVYCHMFKRFPERNIDRVEIDVFFEVTPEFGPSITLAKTSDSASMATVRDFPRSIEDNQKALARSIQATFPTAFNHWSH